MFSTSKSRRHRAERIAGQAWDHLTSAIDSAEASTKHATRRAASFGFLANWSGTNATPVLTCARS